MVRTMEYREPTPERYRLDCLRVALTAQAPLAEIPTNTLKRPSFVRRCLLLPNGEVSDQENYTDICATSTPHKQARLNPPQKAKKRTWEVRADSEVEDSENLDDVDSPESGRRQSMEDENDQEDDEEEQEGYSRARLDARRQRNELNSQQERIVSLCVAHSLPRPTLIIDR